MIPVNPLSETVIQTLRRIDEQIKQVAYTDKAFSTVALVAPYLENGETPELVHEIVLNLLSRGFVVFYDGDLGELSISWSHPTNSLYDLPRFAICEESLIPELGTQFKAILLYFCQTSGNDYRSLTTIDLFRQIEREAFQASVKGLQSLEWSLAKLSEQAHLNLFPNLFTLLLANKYDVRYNQETLKFVVRWVYYEGFQGESLEVELTL